MISLRGFMQELEYFLTDEDSQELNDVIAKVKASGRRLEDVNKDDFPLPVLGPKLQAIHDDLVFGRGIRVLKNLPLGPPSSERYAFRDGLCEYCLPHLHFKQYQVSRCWQG